MSHLYSQKGMLALPSLHSHRHLVMYSVPCSMDVRGALRTPRLHAKICTSGTPSDALLYLGAYQQTCRPSVSATVGCQTGSARPPAPLCGLAHVAPRSSSRRRSLAVRASAVVSEPAVVTRSTPVPAPAPPAPATELVPPAGAYAKVRGFGSPCSVRHDEWDMIHS